MTGETTGAARAAAIADLEAASRILARTGVAVRIPGRSLANRAANRERLEALSRIVARNAHTGAHTGAESHLPARAAFESVVSLLEAAEAGTVHADDEQLQVLRDAYRVVATLAIQEALENYSGA